MKKYVLFSLSAILLIGTGFIISENKTPMCVVFPEKMNVFYAGVDNPIHIEASGVDPEQLSPSLMGGTIRKANGSGNYLVHFFSDSRWEVTINVAFKSDSVARHELGNFKFRVKKVPDPVLYVYNHKHDDTIPAGDIQNELGIFTKMENFDFDCAFIPVSFELSIYHNSSWNNFKADGPLFTPEMKKQLMLLDHGDHVIFHHVMVKLKGSETDTARKINGISLVVR